jgi:hypothetical protein
MLTTRLAIRTVSIAGCLLLWKVDAAAQLQCTAGTIRYHDGGGIKACEIEANHQFYTPRGDRLKCRRGADVVLHPNGAVAAWTIGEAHTFAGKPCDRAGRVELSPYDELVVCGGRYTLSVRPSVGFRRGS